MKALLQTILVLTFATTAWASGEQDLAFTCKSKENPENYAVVKVNSNEYNSMETITEDILATVELYADGQRVKKADNGVIGERLPLITEEGVTYWAFSLDMGRSGNLSMGYDAVNGSWTMGVETIELYVSQSADNAECSFEPIN